MEVLEWEEREKGSGNIFENIMPEKFQICWKNDMCIHKTQWLSSKARHKDYPCVDTLQ